MGCQIHENPSLPLYLPKASHYIINKMASSTIFNKQANKTTPVFYLTTVLPYLRKSAVNIALADIVTPGNQQTTLVLKRTPQTVLSNLCTDLLRLQRKDKILWTLVDIKTRDFPHNTNSRRVVFSRSLCKIVAVMGKNQTCFAISWISEKAYSVLCDFDSNQKFRLTDHFWEDNICIEIICTFVKKDVYKFTISIDRIVYNTPLRNF